jgi:hypothetical protein
LKTAPRSSPLMIAPMRSALSRCSAKNSCKI